MLLTGHLALGAEVTVTLRDASSSLLLSDQEITAYHLSDSAERQWYARQISDSQGQVTFDLEGIEQGETYVVSAKVYSDYRVYSPAFSQINQIELVVGQVTVQVLNGTEPNQPPFAHQSINIKRLLADGQTQWFAAATTDANGLLRIDLPEMASQGYVLSTKSPVSGQYKTSAVMNTAGEYQFVVGNLPLDVSVRDGISGAAFAETKIDVYWLDSDNKRQWYANGYTDSQGQVRLDLEQLGSGRAYVLRTLLFNSNASYSELITQTGQYHFEVGTVQMTVLDGTQTPAVPLANHKVYFYQQQADQSYQYYDAIYTDNNGIVRTDLSGLNNNVSYQAKAKNPQDDNTSYYQMVQKGNNTLLVGELPVNVNLIDALSGAPLANKEITAYQLLANGDKQWYSRSITDDSGHAQLFLKELSASQPYILAVNAFGQSTAYTRPIVGSGTVDFSVGTVAIQLKNGSVGSETGFPPLPETKLVVMKVENDQDVWFHSTYSDSQGQVRLDLPDLGQGAVYRVKSPSPVSGDYRYSDLITHGGSVEFVVGSQATHVVLRDGISGAAIGGQRIDAYWLDADDKKYWYSHGLTNDAGEVSFDLADISSTRRYILRTSVFNDHGSYSPILSQATNVVMAVGGSQLQVTNGSVSPRVALAAQKVNFYQQLADQSLQYFTTVYSDVAGMIRVDLPDISAGKSYVARANSATANNASFQKQMAPSGVTELIVGAEPSIVTLSDALLGDTLPGQEITAYQIKADGSQVWFTRQTTDDQGQVRFELPNMADGQGYQLAVRAFGEAKSYSRLLTEAGAFNFAVGANQIQLLNGSDNGQSVLADRKLTVLRVEGEQNIWVDALTSDANGVVRLDLPGLGEGTQYRFRAASVINNSNKYSDVMSQTGVFNFVVGNPEVAVHLTNQLTGDNYVGQQITAYRLDDNGEPGWYAAADTDSSGIALFDLDDINQGRGYLFKAHVFASGSSPSRIITFAQPVELAIGAVPVTLIDTTSQQLLAGIKVTAYTIGNDGQLTWTKSGLTNTVGQITFDLPGLTEGNRYVFKAYNPFGEGNRYYGPVISGIGAVTFYLKQGELGGLDQQAPEIAIESPGLAVANANGFIVTGSAADNHVVAKVDVTVTDPLLGRFTVAATYDDQFHTWQAAVPAHWLSVQQTILVEATATDAALNQTTDSRYYLVSNDVTPPVIEITSHQPLQTVNAVGFTVIGLVSDDIGIASLTATLVDPILGETMSQQPLNIGLQSGQWALPITNGKVSVDQQIQITLVATDLNGQVTEQQLLLNSVLVATNTMQLAQRITFGLTPALLAQVNGGEDILAEQLQPQAIDDSVFETSMANFAVADSDDLSAYVLTYMTHSKKQLREVMTWFWDNHFNTDVRSHGNVAWEVQENNAFRQHALGRFRDLLAASAKSPAMIRYLNNQQNVAGRANENYAREIMELHTLGVNGGYNATDIAELARIFTGWHEQNGVFVFNDNLHDDGNKFFLGQAIAGVSNGGDAEGEQVLDILASHPATAGFICSKLITLFVSDQPLADLTGQCAAEFLASDGDITGVLQVIFNSSGFADSNHYRNKVKTPLELLVSTARGFNAQINATAMGRELGHMGMRLFEFPAPTGYSEVAEDWLNSNAVLQRVRMVNHMAWQRSDAFSVDFAGLLTQQGYSSAEAIISFLFELTLANEYTDLDYQLALQILNEGGGFDINAANAQHKLNRLLGTVLSFPGYQYQ